MLVWTGQEVAPNHEAQGQDSASALAIRWAPALVVSPAATMAWILLAGIALGLVAIFGGLVYVSPAEHTFCLAASRSAGVLAVTIATLVLKGCGARLGSLRVDEMIAVAMTLVAIAALAVNDRAATP